MMRYIIGIDLGTTNSCVAFIDTRESRPKVYPFKIPQLKSPGSVESFSTLPSFCYLAQQDEWSSDSLALPWSSTQKTLPNFFVGAFAREQGSRVPTRLVQSAKSWLCHHAANRGDKILPVEAADESIRISPLEATSRYLSHIRHAWNHVKAKGDPEADFDDQEIVLTVPASFDEAARTLTVEAAKSAGFAHLTLIEEPQAAFYSWIAGHEAVWDKMVSGGMRILVCDVGGGTTDFSLIEAAGDGEKHVFKRMAVGDHLLLGGDNMDAAVLHLLESKLAERGTDLSSTQRMQLLYEARRIKEEAFTSTEKQGKSSVVIQGTGSKVVGGALTLEVGFDEVREFLLAGFFKVMPWDQALQLKSASGLRSMGLPYEDDPCITKHLARFLSHNGMGVSGPAMPDLVLFNGGAMKPKPFQEAVVSSLRLWFPDKQLEILPSQSLDLAVAIGAAYYGKARRGEGVKIGGGLARGCYLILDTQDKGGKSGRKALTLLPRGSEEGEVFEPPMTFMLSPNVPVSFRLCSSHTRLHDRKGDLIDITSEEMQFLPPIHTILRFGKKQLAETTKQQIPVTIQAALTPIGTIELNLKSVSSDNRWKLEFQVKSASGHEDALASIGDRIDAGQTFQSGFLKEAEKILESVYADGVHPGAVMKLVDNLEGAVGMLRGEWPSGVSRGLFDVLIKLAPMRKLSAAHWERWWNLSGFLLRPGFGYPMDDFRFKELWKIILADSKGTVPPEVQTQMWIAYRRVAGGMNKGQQMQIGSDLIFSILGKKSETIDIKLKSELYSYSEKMRALAALELIDSSSKVRLANALLRRIKEKKALPAEYWALGRIGARHLVYGSMAQVIPAALCEGWLNAIFDSVSGASLENDQPFLLLIEQLARKTQHRELNLSQPCINMILRRLEGVPDYQRLEELLTKENSLSRKEQDKVFGDHLPSGLSLEVET